MTAATGQTPPTRQLRITFRQYDGEMLGTCWCGLTRESPHPRLLWEWLDDHEHQSPESAGAENGRTSDEH